MKYFAILLLIFTILPVMANSNENKIIDLTEAQSSRLVISLQKQRNLSLMLENIKLRMDLLQKEYEASLEDSKVTFEEICEELDVDPKMAKPISDFTQIEVVTGE